MSPHPDPATALWVESHPQLLDYPDSFQPHQTASGHKETLGSYSAPFALAEPPFLVSPVDRKLAQ